MKNKTSILNCISDLSWVSEQVGEEQTNNLRFKGFSAKWIIRSWITWITCSHSRSVFVDITLRSSQVNFSLIGVVAPSPVDWVSAYISTKTHFTFYIGGFTCVNGFNWVTYVNRLNWVTYVNGLNWEQFVWLPPFIAQVKSSQIKSSQVRCNVMFDVVVMPVWIVFVLKLQVHAVWNIIFKANHIHCRWTTLLSCMWMMMVNVCS